MSETNNYGKLNAFFEKEYDLLKSYVRSRLSDSADRDAEDIVQDVALKLFAGAGSGAPINNVAGFVFRSVKNKIIDTRRTNKPKNSIDTESELKLNEMMDQIYGSADNVYPEQLKNALMPTINRLKPHYRQIITAVDFEGYNYKEISLETGIPEGTLMSRRHRALSVLHQELIKTQTK